VTGPANPPLSLRRDFTVRERRIAEMIGDGKSYREIARAFNPRISPLTVRGYVNRMAAKIDVVLADASRELTPRQAVYMLVQFERWERSRAG
jgi:DNA-binding CsgD family transcriptional regulator